MEHNDDELHTPVLYAAGSTFWLMVVAVVVTTVDVAPETFVVTENSTFAVNGTAGDVVRRLDNCTAGDSARRLDTMSEETELPGRYFLLTES